MPNLYARLEACFPADRARTFAEAPDGTICSYADLVAGPNVFKGYWRAPEKTAAEFRDGFFVSGDFGMIDDKGYVSILGRSGMDR